MRSCNDLRDTSLLSETAGEVACGVTLGALGSLPMVLLLPEPGESLARGGDVILDESTRGLGAGVLIDGRDGVADIDRPPPCGGLAGTLGAGRLSLTDALGLGEDCGLGLGANILCRAVARSCIKSRPAPGAGWVRTDGPGELTAGGLLRKVGADGLLSIRGLGEDWNERDWPGLDIPPDAELPRGVNDCGADICGAGADICGAGADMRGAGADMRGAGLDMRGAGLDTLGAGLDMRGAGLDIRAPSAPRPDDLPWADAPDAASRTSPAATFITAAREFFLFSPATAISYSFSSPAGFLASPQHFTGFAAGTLHD